MSDVQSRSQRNREWAYVGFALLPPLAVLAILLVGVWKERVASSDVTAKLASLQQHGEPIGNASLSKFYDSRTTRSTARRWQAVLASTRALSGKFDGATVQSFDQLVPPKQAWPAEEFANQFSKEARPVLDEIRRLAAEEQPVWQPLLFDGINTLLPELQDSRQIRRLIINEFRVAYHAGDHQRALDALSMMHVVERAFDWQIFAVVELVRLAQVGPHRMLIRDSLAFDFWTSEDLQTIRSQLSPDTDLDQRWQRTFATERSMTFSELRIAEAGDAKSAAIIDGVNFAPFGIASTHERTLLSIYDKIQSIRGVGTTMHVDQSRDVFWFTSYQKPTSSETSITAIPFALNSQTSQYYVPAVNSISQAYARAEEERRMTVTAVGIKQFQLQENRWPNSLAELARVGVGGSDILVDELRNHKFGYRVERDGKSVILWTSINGYGVSGRSANGIPPRERDKNDTQHEMRIR